MIIYKISQSIDAFIVTSNSFMSKKLQAAIELVKKNKESPRKLLYDNNHPIQGLGNYLDELKELDKQANRYYQFLASLQDIASILEKEKFTFKKIYQFHEFKEVKKIIDNLKTIFPEFANDNESV